MAAKWWSGLAAAVGLAPIEEAEEAQAAAAEAAEEAAEATDAEAAAAAEAGPDAAASGEKPLSIRQKKALRLAEMGGPSGFRVHLKNLGEGVTTDRLRQLFEPYGPVVDAEAKLDDDGLCKGIGYVILKSKEEAMRSVKELGGSFFEGEELLVVPCRRTRARGEDRANEEVKDKKTVRTRRRERQIAKVKERARDFYQHPYMYYNPDLFTAMMGTASPVKFVGALKSLSEKSGYGFITCHDVYETYGRDVWVDRESLPENVQVNAMLSFTVTLSAKGHPVAQNVHLAS